MRNGDAQADVWVTTSGCDGGEPAALSGRLVLTQGCGVATVPHEVRTFNFFRHPMTVAIQGVHASAGSLVRVGLAVPSSAAVNRTGWPTVKHYGGHYQISSFRHI